MAGLGGGGSTSGGQAIRAGQAYVEMSVKDSTEAKLKAIQGRMAGLGEQLKRSLEVAGTGGAFGRLLGAGGAAGGVGLAFEALSSQLRGVIPGAKNVAELFDDMRRSAEMGASAVKVMQERFDFMRRAGGEGGTFGLGVNQQELETLRKELARLTRLKSDAAAMGSAAENADGFDQLGGFFGAQIGLGQRTSVIAEEAARAAKEFDAQASKIGERMKVLQAEIDKALNPRLDPAYRAAISGIEQQIQRHGEAVGQYEARVRDLQDAHREAGAVAKKELADLRERAKVFDEHLAQMKIQNEFLAEQKQLEMQRLTQGLSGEDAALARLVERGFSNDQIQQLRRLQEDMRLNALKPPGTTTAGGLAGAGLAQQLGTSSSWVRLEKRVELTNERLDEIRGRLDAINNNLGFK
jgi:hypothetical protein